MDWANLLVVLLVGWLPLLTEGPGSAKNSLTGGWAARALFIVYLCCAVIGTAAAIRIVIHGR